MNYEEYKPVIRLGGGLAPSGSGTFPVARACDILMPDESRLDDYLENMGGGGGASGYTTEWLLNDNVTMASGTDTLYFNFPFKCGEEEFVQLKVATLVMYYVKEDGTQLIVISRNGWANIAYQTIYTQKVIDDLSGYLWLYENGGIINGEAYPPNQPAWDDDLETEDKTIVGAINEINSKVGAGEESFSYAKGDYSEAEGYQTTALGRASHTEGNSTNIAPSSITASTANSTIQTSWNSSKFLLAKGSAAHAEGGNTLALGDYSHAEGNSTQAVGTYSHAEGGWTTASGNYSHAEGDSTKATGAYTHTEGQGSQATANYAHAEGYYTKATGSASHAEGDTTQATGSYSYAGGYNSVASGTCANTHGYYTKAFGNQTVFGHYNTDWTSSSNLHGGTYGTSGVLLVVGNGTSSARANAFRVEGGGQVKAKGAYSASGADYAEFFEWLDGNPNGEDRRGYFVTMEGEKIKIAKAGDYILGVISGLPAVIGNGDEDWRGRYIHDDFGAYILEEFEYEEEVFDAETGEAKVVVKKATKYKENPDYDQSVPYIPREARPEWDTVGMMGVLSVRDDGSCKVNGYCTVDNGGTATAAVDGYRVIKRVNDHIVKIIFR